MKGLRFVFAVKENLHCSQYSANLFRLDFVEVVDIATVDPTIKSGPSIESLKKEAKLILNSYSYNLTRSIRFIGNCFITKSNWNVWRLKKSLLFFGKLRNVDSGCLKHLIHKGKYLNKSVTILSLLSSDHQKNYVSVSSTIT